MKVEEDIRKYKIGFRVSAREKEAIQAYLDTKGLTLSEFLRSLTLSEITNSKSKGEK